MTRAISVLRNTWLLLSGLHRFAPAAIRNGVVSVFDGADLAIRRIHAIPLILLGAGAFGASLFCVFIAVLPLHPSGDEILLSLTVRCGYWFAFLMNTALAVSAAACAAAYSIHNFGKGLTVQWGGDDGRIKALSSGFGDDIPILSLDQDEPPSAVIERKNQAVLNAKKYQWVVCIIFGEELATIVRDGVPEIFTREDAPFIDASASGSAIVPFGYDFRQETWGEYLEYINRFCVLYTPWAHREKIKNGTDGRAFDAVVGGVLNSK